MKPITRMAEKQHHGEKTKEPDVIDNDCPREKKSNLEIEDDEKYRYQIEAHVELHA